MPLSESTRDVHADARRRRARSSCSQLTPKPLCRRTRGNSCLRLNAFPGKRPATAEIVWLSRRRRYTDAAANFVESTDQNDTANALWWLTGGGTPPAHALAAAEQCRRRKMTVKVLRARTGGGGETGLVRAP